MIQAEYNRLFDLRLTILKALDRCEEIACIIHVNSLPEPNKLFEVATSSSLTSGSSRFVTTTVMTLGQCFLLFQSTDGMTVAVCC